MIKNQNTNKNKSSTNGTTSNKKNSSTKANKTMYINKNEWKIVIPVINLEANIAEGTSDDVMNKYVGHFSVTNTWNGNVALAAHNRGYPVNYFANLKNLKKGDLIEYYNEGKVRKYKVEIITKIKDTDWTYLENTKDNRITLITCVENEPEYRRCIQGIEI